MVKHYRAKKKWKWSVKLSWRQSRDLKETINMGAKLSSWSCYKVSVLDMQEISKILNAVGLYSHEVIVDKSLYEVMSGWLASRLPWGFALWRPQMTRCINAETWMLRPGKMPNLFFQEINENAFVYVTRSLL